ncbi:Rhodopirellula transposase DDE domain-containing protein [Streptomyces sp. MnatMP-M77]|nr:Rhodopirellula transposase DDE domain-containing protein [Streptomyces sp. MnatMP-M77]
MGAEAGILGHGGIRAVAQAAEVSKATVRKGVDELEAGAEPLGRVRRLGGGRKRAAEVDPGLRPALLALVQPGMRGDPMSPLRWTTKSTRKLADELTRQGHRVSADSVADLLREEGLSLRANAKTVEGAQHPDREAQFRYINDRAKEHMGVGDPVISVDTKKKELVGPYKKGGREWRPKGLPTQVRTHDFLDRQGLARRSLTGSTTSPRTPDGSVSARITTRPRSPLLRSVAGGRPVAVTTTLRPPGC